MGGRYLLDTTTAIAVLESQVDLESRRNRGIEVFLCLTVVGELFFGAEKSQRVEANRKRVEGLSCQEKIYRQTLPPSKMHSGCSIFCARW